MFGPGDGGIEPAVVILGAPAEAFVKDNYRAEGGSLGLVTGDRVAPAGLDQTTANLPFMTMAVWVVEDVIVVFAAPELVLPRDLQAILGLDPGVECPRIMRMRSHTAQRQEHAIDQPKIMTIAQTDGLFTGTGGVIRGKASGLLHSHVNAPTGRVLATDHLTAVEKLRRCYVALRHLPDTLIEGAVRDRLALARHGG